MYLDNTIINLFTSIYKNLDITILFNLTFLVKRVYTEISSPDIPIRSFIPEIPQGLSPKSIIQEFKTGLRSAGINAGKPDPAPVSEDREYRKVPVHRLTAKLGLSKYDVPSSFDDEVCKVSRVRIPMSQHIGAPANPVVQTGDMVREGQIIGSPSEGLSAGVHASISGTVTNVTEKYIEISSL